MLFPIFLEGWTRWWTSVGGGSPPSTPLPPLPSPCLPPPFFQRRALCARKIFFCFPPSLFPNFSPLSLPAPSPPSPTPSFHTSLFPCPPPHEQVTKSLQLKFKYMCFYIIIVFRGLLCADILCIIHVYDNLRYFVFLWRRRWTFLGFFFLFFFLFLFDFDFFLCICPKLRKDKSYGYVGMKRRHLAGQNLAGVNKRLMYFVIARECFSLFGEDGRAIRRRLL